MAESRSRSGAGDRSGSGSRNRRATGAGSGDGALAARDAALRAADHVRELTGREPEGVTSLSRTEDGWQVGVEVVESRRIPDSTDVLAVYRVDLDAEGDLISYGRADRYYRGRADKE